jgi:hypothetical protein
MGPADTGQEIGSRIKPELQYRLFYFEITGAGLETLEFQDVIPGVQSN